MGTGPATIDLGVYTYRSAPEAVSERRRPIRAQLARWRRRVAVVAVAALAGGLGGSAAPPPPQLIPLWTLPGGPYDESGVAAGATDLYAVTGTKRSPTLTALRLADGAVRWVAPLEPSGSPARQAAFDPQVTVIDGVPVVYTFDGVGSTAGYDPDTAQIRWTSQGLPDYVAGGLVGLATFVFEEPDPAQVGLELRDVSSGTVVATFDDPQGYGHRETPGGGIQVFTLDRNGVLSSYDLATGAVVGAASTPYENSPADPRRSSVTVAGGVVVVAGELGVDEVLTAYDAGTLERLWSAPGEGPVRACGPVVCVGGAGGLLRGIAPRTGAPQWSIGCADLGVPGECILLASSPDERGRLAVRLQLRVRGAGEPAVQYLVLDAGTGQRLAGPTEWEIRQRGSGSLLSRDSDPDLVWWARSDADLDRVEVIGAVEADWCSSHDPYLVCHTAGGAIEVWQATSSHLRRERGNAAGP